MRDDKGYFLGHYWPADHRTVGEVRAWSYPAGEWCYPSIPCTMCAEQMRSTRPCPACQGKGYIEVKP